MKKIKNKRNFVFIFLSVIFVVSFVLNFYQLFLLQSITKEIDITKKASVNIIKEQDKKIKYMEKVIEETKNKEEITSSAKRVFQITHYSSEETGSNITASGNIAKLNHTVACNSLPFGTRVKINNKIYTVEDTGDMGEDGIDIYVSNSAEAFQLGRYTAEVEIFE